MEDVVRSAGDGHDAATLYVETSIIGYLTARSRDEVIFKARQDLTRACRANRREHYRLFTSQLVVDESSAGDRTAALERLALLDGLPLLDIGHPDVEPLAERLIERHLLPEKARADARHVAVAAAFGIDYLLTWNCKHIANADTLPGIYLMLRNAGFEPPLILTPDEFSEHE